MRPLRGIDTFLWAPLIDGTYAIVLTLLVIELPSMAMELVREFNHDTIGLGPLITGMLRLIAGYLGVFLIIFDIWTKKRRMLSITEKYCDFSSSENLVMLLSLFFATLLPPLVRLAWQVKQEYVFQQLTSRIKNIEMAEVTTLQVFFGVCTVLIYAMILLGNSRRCAQLRRKIIAEYSDDIKRDLNSALARMQAVRRDTFARIVASPMVLFAWLSPHIHILILIYGLSGLWHTDHQKDVLGRNTASSNSTI